MNSTSTTPATAAGGRQVGQVLAGRYRLAVFKGGDDIADVWHALDQSTEQVVTLEILRDRDNEAARQRFLAEAQRMAAIERPSVMRVAAIHNEIAETFIVFEHLIPLPVVLTGLTAVASDARPATKPADDPDKTVVIAPSAPQGPAPVTPPTLSAVVGPTRAADGGGDALSAPAIVELDETAAAPVAQSFAVDIQPAASRPLDGARSDAALILGEVKAIGADARLLLHELKLDRFAAAARAFLPKGFDTRALSDRVARATSDAASRMRAAAQEATTRVPRSDATSATGAAQTAAMEKTVRVAKTVGVTAMSTLATIASAAGPIAKRLAATAGPHLSRARGNRVVLAGVTATLLLVVLVLSPLDDTLTNTLRSGSIALPTAVPSGGLAPAPFEVPPLAEYGATFDSQGAYPRTTPGGTVEWVVALRNTGSAGWYRGIEGAQAALALADGTGVAVQSTQYVAPGQVGWFVVRFRARSEVGTYTVQLLPRIDGRGPLPDLGIYAVVTVARNP
ncbi:MAG TPA: hypothetical protein VJP45_05875 [Candidatus Limnocylindria bacterium]|nr:hypothetical protein [Candidatus Limnocylindria bacterium]